MDSMTCPVCKGIVTRDPQNRMKRFVCGKCGWSSWKTRVEVLQEFLAKEQAEEDRKSHD